MADEFLNFSLRNYSSLRRIFSELENEEENEFLAAVDLEAVNVTDKVTVEKADRSNEVNKHRFVNQTPELSYNAHPSSYQFKAC